MIVVADPEGTEERLSAGQLSCPECAGRLRPYGHARTRTVRGLGSTRVTTRPRRARCADCRATQVLLPATMTCRRADSTEVIGHALAAKATGAGFRAIAARLGRPPSTVRAWAEASPPRARGLALPAGRAALHPRRPGTAGPPGEPAHDARRRVEPPCRRSPAPSGAVQSQRPAVGADELHEQRSPARTAAENVTEPPPPGTLCPHPRVTMPSNRDRRTPNSVTVQTTASPHRRTRGPTSAF